MRMDERVADIVSDPADPRGALLAASAGELAQLGRALGLGGAASPDEIAKTLEDLIEKAVPGGGEADKPMLRLAGWAAERLGAGGGHRDLGRADDELISRAGAADPAAAALPAGDAGDRQRILLAIAVQLAYLRRKRLERLRRWRPLLDFFVKAKPRPADLRAPHAAPSPKAAPAIGEAGLDPDILWETIRGAAGRLPLSTWEEKLTDARKTIGRFNIIVAGRTGVGKTTLIGAIFGEEIGNTLMGRPRTRGRIWYPASPGEADILRLCDTEGLEMERYAETLDGLKREIETRNASGDPFDHIHVAWLCIDEPSLTVQPGEEALVEMLAREGIPVIVVLTKAGMAPAFKDTVQKILPRARAVVRVRAAPIVIEGQTFPPMGLPELLQATEEAIPDAVEAAWHVASRNLDAMLRRCETLVKRAAAAAGAAGAAPIPLADAAGVFGIQVGMIIAVSLNMGVKLQRADLQAMAVTLLGALGLTAGGRFLAGQFAKLIPGLGTIAGSAITGTTAAALTYGLGRAYLEYLRRFFEQNKRMPAADELVTGFRVFWGRWKNKEELPPNIPGS
jgi:uncharacterized protein (DUF697 family)